MNLSEQKKTILRLLDSQPVCAAMFLKNWRRYASSVTFLTKAGNISPRERILDYGGGYPFVAKILSLLGYSVDCYEPYATESEWQVAKALGMENQYYTDITDGRQYDYVLMIDVIEHLSIIKPTMQDVHSKLKSGGCVFISTPNVLRIEMWLKFVFRKTGHPQEIYLFVESDNNYVNHQREFTMKELQYTLRFFGFSTVSAFCKDTQPTWQELKEYHRVIGKPPVKQSLTGMLLRTFYMLFKFLFPNQLSNNLFVLARKK